MSDIELPPDIPPDIPLDIPLDENFIYDPRGNPRGSPPDIYEQMFDIGEYEPDLTDEYVDVEKPSIEQEIIKAKEIIFTRKFDKFNIKQNYLIKNKNENEYTNIGQLISVLINNVPAETVFETKFLTKTKPMKLQIKFQKNITDKIITFEYEIHYIRISEHNFFLILKIIQNNNMYDIIIVFKRKTSDNNEYEVKRIIDENNILELYKKKIQTKGGKKSKKRKFSSRKHKKKSRKHQKKSRKHR